MFNAQSRLLTKSGRVDRVLLSWLVRHSRLTLPLEAATANASPDILLTSVRVFCRPSTVRLTI